MFKKILIANRGEIACRILRTTQRMGIASVVVYSEADRFSQAVLQADEAHYVGPSLASSSYLNIEALLKAACESGAEAIHPGYGFLSESAAFARACQAQNLVWIGPSIEALEIMGSKQRAKQHLAAHGIPMIPGYHGQDQSDERLTHEAHQIGFPLLLKAAAGGGGKGMRVVHHKDEWEDALRATRREALAYFGDDTLLIEKQITHARHLEVQVMADHHGRVISLFERDCSLQRRHQKIIEEAPGPHVTDALRQQLTEAAVRIAQSIQYLGAGTIEFLVDEHDHLYFMEMNTRLQVEHPVTEMITGLDLVEQQIRIAAQEPLADTTPSRHGHAIECRLYAEDPLHDFLPSVGQLTALSFPNIEHVRIESGIACHDIVTHYYDPMIAKIIAWGETRAEAIQRLKQTLSQVHLAGIHTNRDFLQAILCHSTFLTGSVHTDFLDKTPLVLEQPEYTEALFFAACLDYLGLYASNDALRGDTIGFQLHTNNTWCWRYRIHQTQHDVWVTPLDAQHARVRIHDVEKVLTIRRHLPYIMLDHDGQTWRAWAHEHATSWTLDTAKGTIQVMRCHEEPNPSSHDTLCHELVAPMPSTVVAVLTKVSEPVRKGDRLMVLEAMKMEHTLYAPYDGHLSHLFYEVGAQVSEGMELLRIEPQDETHAKTT